MVEYIERRVLMERFKKSYCKDCQNYNGVRCGACCNAIDILKAFLLLPLRISIQWLNGLHRMIRLQGSSAADATREIIIHVGTTAQTVEHGWRKQNEINQQKIHRFAWRV